MQSDNKEQTNNLESNKNSCLSMLGKLLVASVIFMASEINIIFGIVLSLFIVVIYYVIKKYKPTDDNTESLDEENTKRDDMNEVENESQVIQEVADDR